MKFANFKITFISSRLFRVQKKSYTNENTQVIINRNNYNEFKLTYRKHKKNHIFTTNDIKVKTDDNGNVLYVLFLSSNKVGSKTWQTSFLIFKPFIISIASFSLTEIIS